MEALKTLLETHRQDHLLDGYSTLMPEERSRLVANLQAIDYAHVNRAFKASITEASAPNIPPEPVKNVVTLSDTSPEDTKRWRDTGLNMIADGQLGILLLAVRPREVVVGGRPEFELPVVWLLVHVLWYSARCTVHRDVPRWQKCGSLGAKPRRSS